MPKPEYKEFDKECPICGGIIWGKGRRVLIEGGKITVCLNCAQHGEKLPTASTHISSKKPQTSGKTKHYRRKVYEKDVTDDIEIVQDFAKKIRNARTSRGFNQDQFAQKLNEKPSLLRRIETGRAKPTIKLAKKIEEVYKIKLLQKGDIIEGQIQDDKFMKKSTRTSLGDIAFIKKKKL